MKIITREMTSGTNDAKKHATDLAHAIFVTFRRARVDGACCSGHDGPTMSFDGRWGQTEVLIDCLAFPTVADDRFGEARFPLKYSWDDKSENIYFYAWSQVFACVPKAATPKQTIDALWETVVFRGQEQPVAEVAFQGFLGCQEAARFLRERLEAQRNAA